MTPKLLITGSRDASIFMLDYTRRVVERALERQWHIVVGDALGVDEAVVETANRIGIPYESYGITQVGRNSVRVVGNYIKAPNCTTYLQRDDYMVSLANYCIAIWNGESRGTIYTYKQAEKKGITVWLKTFK